MLLVACGAVWTAPAADATITRHMVFFGSDLEGHYGTWESEPDGLKPLLVNRTTPRVSTGVVGLSPNGRKLAWGYQGSIHVSDITGNNDHVVFEARRGYWAYSPAFSPEETKLIFAAEENSEGQVFSIDSINLDGTEFRTLANEGS